MFGSDARKKRAQPDADRRIAAYLIKRGDAARDARHWARAALWYEEALLLVPQRADIHVQRGHMLKEASAFEEAEQAYLAAGALIPDDSDLALQLGHFYKVAGRREDARAAYERALILKPGWNAAEHELAILRITAQPEASAAAPVAPIPPDADAFLAEAARSLADPGRVAGLIPALAPSTPTALLRDYRETLELRQMGQHEPGFWGMRRTVRGATAVRGFCISSAPVDEVQMLLDGRLFYRGPVRGPYPLKYESRPTLLRKYVFNIWYDFSSLGAGRHAFELRTIDADGESRAFHDDIVIAAPLKESDFPDSDAVVEIGDPDSCSLERRIRERESKVRPAQRDLLPRSPENILVLRTDQLGDMVASVPAMRRLREIFPKARIVGLLTGANAELAATLGLFDEIIVIDFPDDSLERRRVMPLPAQDDLRRRLAPYSFDLAIDLAQAGVSRELLLLSGAPFLYGVEGGSFHWLSADFALNTRDPLNRLDRNEL